MRIHDRTVIELPGRETGARKFRTTSQLQESGDKCPLTAKWTNCGRVRSGPWESKENELTRATYVHAVPRANEGTAEATHSLLELMLSWRVRVESYLLDIEILPMAC